MWSECGVFVCVVHLSGMSEMSVCGCVGITKEEKQTW